MPTDKAIKGFKVSEKYNYYIHNVNENSKDSVKISRGNLIALVTPVDKGDAGANGNIGINNVGFGNIGSDKWKNQSEGMLGTYLSEGVVNSLKNIKMTVEKNKVKKVNPAPPYENTLENPRNSDKITNVRDVVLSFLYQISNSKVGNIRLKDSENSSTNDKGKSKSNSDTLGVYNSLIYKQYSDNKGVFQVLGINSLITLRNSEYIYSTKVIDGEIPENLKSKKNNQSSQLWAQTKRESGKGENRDRNEYPKVQTTFPNVLYYHQGKANKHPTDPRIKVTVDIVFVDKVPSIPKYVRDVVNDIDSIKEKVALMNDYYRYAGENNLKELELMGFFVKDNKANDRATTNIKKRGNNVQEISTEGKSTNSRIGYLNRQSEQSDKIHEEKKGSFYRTAMNSNNNRQQYQQRRNV
ncbi:hypothetical protein AYI69_g11408 [Smittium culicis]|uniref:Uncharacterized protein n=1 Tax=Smittium culicis TaxID=133412 RepID=A0A1R1WYY6_9FUNG|nr:hypothetical protein AYI69_g11408 [Smittium culicis]